MTTPPTALEGLRVLDVATLFPGPLVAAMLGDLGADVVKVEAPRGDTLRSLGLRAADRSLVWSVVSRNKRCITLNLADERGQELLAQLVERADVLVENFPPATAQRFGCSWDQLRQVNPRLIAVSVSCYGRSGPYADRAGNGTLAEAFGGLTNMTGEADGPPMLTSLPIGDVLTGMHGLNGVLAACYHRDARGGSGQHVDVSMYEPILQFVQNGITRYDQTGEVDRRSGSQIPGSVPRNVYQTRDDAWVALSAITDAMVARLLGAMGRDDPERMQRFGSVAARGLNGPALDADVADWVRQHDRDEVMERLVAARIPISPVNDVSALWTDPHIQARGNLVSVSDPQIGEMRMLSPRPSLSETPARIRHTGRELGEHNAEIYAEIGIAEGELESLREAGVI